MDEFPKICEVLVQIARLLLAGKIDDAISYLRRKAFQNRKSTLMLWSDLNKMFNAYNESEGGRTYERSEETGGFDLTANESNAYSEFLLKDFPPIALQVEPIYEEATRTMLNMIVVEQKKRNEILDAGLSPSSKFLFVGAPGVGKTLAAKWLSNVLSLPLYTLNLATVMSSFLGKTGNNIHHVFDFAARHSGILLLDEFDAIAKKRNDDAEVGELKRLVTVLLQEIDSFGETGLLIAATNHPELLDPAVTRRFDVEVEFSLPSRVLAKNAFKVYMGNDYAYIGDFVEIMASVLDGKPFSEIKAAAFHIRKSAILTNEPVSQAVAQWLSARVKGMSVRERRDLAVSLIYNGYTQRKAYDITGISRDTIRKEIKRRG